MLESPPSTINKVTLTWIRNCNFNGLLLKAYFSYVIEKVQMGKDWLTDVRFYEQLWRINNMNSHLVITAKLFDECTFYSRLQSTRIKEKLINIIIKLSKILTTCKECVGLKTFNLYYLILFQKKKKKKKKNFVN